jgi:hypothetical protein
MFSSSKLVPAMFAALLLCAPAAHAYPTDDSALAAKCDYQTWSAPPRVVIHTSEFAGGGATRQANMIAAIEAVDAEFNLVGATSAQITGTETTTDPFTVTTKFDTSEPVIHVGFVPSLKNPDAVAVTKRWGDSGCHLVRANIGVLDLDHFDWRFNQPEDAGENFWEAGAKDDDGKKYFRTSYLHELLHAFGLNHDDSHYSFMNYSARPWANRAGDDRIRPLPRDVRLLRDRYPAAGERTEVAALSTWYDEDDVSDSGAATGKVLCAPSLGDDFTDKLFADHCGTGGSMGGSTTVCARDMLRTRYAVANYSTHPVDEDARLYFSTDAQWDYFDVASPTLADTIHQTTESSERGTSFEVPAGLVSGTTYYTILRVTGGATDWIPLPGTVTACW